MLKIRLRNLVCLPHQVKQKEIISILKYIHSGQADALIIR